MKAKNCQIIKKEINIGISILRVILSLMVVLDHFYNAKKMKKYYSILYYHIPTFFVISFYYNYKTLTSFNSSKIKSRFKRILIPYFSWCTISWMINNIYYHILKKKCRHSFRDYLINLMNGHIFLVPLWFQNNLFLLTLVFTIIIFLFKNKYIYILNILSLLAIISQYSGFNYTFFTHHFQRHTYLSLGRFTEAFPNAFIGFFIAKFDLINNIEKKKIISLFSFIILMIITKYNIFSNLKTFKYGGIRLNVAATCIFIIFSLLPFQKIKNKLLINGLIKITNYTAGIYFTHYLIGHEFFFELLLKDKRDTFLGCIIIYFVSYCASFIGSKLFRKTIFRHLFA